MLSVRNLEVVYDDTVLTLRGVTIDVEEGQIVALLGANGAGKTTLLRAIGGLLGVHDGEITKGEVQFRDERLNDLEPAEIVSLGIGQVLEGRRIFIELSVEDNLRVGAFTNPSKDRFEENLGRVYGLFPILRERRHLSAGYLSGGEQQMLAMGRALMSSPKLLVLDEPSLGLAPQLVSQVRDVIMEIHQQGAAILLVEQNAHLALSLASHGYVLENGKIVLDNPTDELVRDRDVREFYLGMGADGKRDYANVKHYRRRKRWLS